MDKSALQTITVALLLGLPLVWLFGGSKAKKVINPKVWFGIMFSASLMLFTALVIYVWPNVHLGPTIWYDEIKWKMTLIYLLVLIGMLLAELTKSSVERTARKEKLEKKGIVTKVPFAFDWRNLVSYIALALIPCGGVLVVALDSNLSKITVMLALQNGFYWHTTLQKGSWKNAVKAVQSMGRQ